MSVHGILNAEGSTIRSSEQLLICGYLGYESTVYLDKSNCNLTGRFTVSNNLESYYVLNSLVTFLRNVKVLDCSQPIEKLETMLELHGGAIHATGSTVHMGGETTIAKILSRRRISLSE